VRTVCNFQIGILLVETNFMLVFICNYSSFVHRFRYNEIYGFWQTINLIISETVYDRCKVIDLSEFGRNDI